jgi:tripartite-type tricarboxylate transporter receptor subunit TctC
MIWRSSNSSLSMICLGFVVLAAIGQAPAQDYPNRPVRWLLGFAPGGPNDVLARLLGQHLSKSSGSHS